MRTKPVGLSREDGSLQPATSRPVEKFSVFFLETPNCKFYLEFGKFSLNFVEGSLVEKWFPQKYIRGVPNK